MTSPAATRVVILDTDVFSFIYGNRPQAQPYLPHLRGMIAAITFVTEAELLKGAYKRWSAKNITKLEERIRSYLIIPYDSAIALAWARIQNAHSGRQYPENDAWVAACAITFGCPLLSHNRRHFHDIPGLNLITYAPE